MPLLKPLGFIACAPLVVVAAVAAAPAATAAPSDCKPVAVLAFRGSDEKNLKEDVTSSSGDAHRYGSSNLVTNGWEGPRLEKLLTSFAGLPAYGDGFRPDSIPVFGVGPDDATTEYGYEAPAAAWEVLDRLNFSAIDGAKAALATMAQFQSSQRSAGCTVRTRFILTGYSQGAMVARIVAGANTQDIVGVVNIGDPYQKPNASGNEGSKPGGDGIVRWKWPLLAGTLDKYYDLDLQAKTAICHDGDPICDFRWGTVAALLAPKEHESYYSVNDEAPKKAQQIADLAHGTWQLAQRPGGGTSANTGSIDAVFAIDTTGSMGGYISQAVATAESVARSTLARSPGSRVGLVQYRDHGDAFVAQTVVPLTSDFGALTTGLRSLSANGGGDLPEAVFSGIVEAASQDWKAGSARSIIVIGDAPPHDPESVTGYTARSVTDMLTGAAPIMRPMSASTGRYSRIATSSLAAITATGDEDAGIVLYTASSDTSLSNALTPISNETGGLVLSMDNASGLDEALEAALEDTTEAPFAAVDVPDPVVEGLETLVSATGTTAGDPNLTYDFDLDGDGTFETPSTSGLAPKTFSTAGTKSVGVRVTDSRGRTSTATTSVEVLPATVAEPAVDTTTPTVTVTADPSADQGAQARLSLSGGTPTEYLLVPVGDVSRALTVEPTYSSVMPADWQRSGVLVPASVPAGNYQLVVGTAEGRWGGTKLAVRARSAAIGTPKPAVSATPIAAPTPALPTPSTSPTSKPRPTVSPTQTPTPTATPTITPVPLSDDNPTGNGPGSGLPVTGFDLALPLLAGLITLAAGISFLIFTARRRRPEGR